MCSIAVLHHHHVLTFTCTLILIVTFFCAHSISGLRPSHSLRVRTCEPIRVSLCQNVGYNRTGFPNLAGHDEQRDADLELHTFRPLLQSKCSPHIHLLLCSVFTPLCSEKVCISRVRFINAVQIILFLNPPILLLFAQVLKPIGPCRSLCESVRFHCEHFVRAFQLEWPTLLNCDRFLPANRVDQMCIEKPNPFQMNLHSSSMINSSSIDKVRSFTPKASSRRPYLPMKPYQLDRRKLPTISLLNTSSSLFTTTEPFLLSSFSSSASRHPSSSFSSSSLSVQSSFVLPTPATTTDPRLTRQITHQFIECLPHHHDHLGDRSNHDFTYTVIFYFRLTGTLMLFGLTCLALLGILVSRYEIDLFDHPFHMITVFALLISALDLYELIASNLFQTASLCSLDCVHCSICLALAVIRYAAIISSHCWWACSSYFFYFSHLSPLQSTSYSQSAACFHRHLRRFVAHLIITVISICLAGYALVSRAFQSDPISRVCSLISWSSAALHFYLVPLTACFLVVLVVLSVMLRRYSRRFATLSPSLQDLSLPPLQPPKPVQFAENVNQVHLPSKERRYCSIDQIDVLIDHHSCTNRSLSIDCRSFSADPLDRFVNRQSPVGQSASSNITDCSIGSTDDDNFVDRVALPFKGGSCPDCHLSFIIPISSSSPSPPSSPSSPIVNRNVTALNSTLISFHLLLLIVRVVQYMQSSALEQPDSFAVHLLLHTFSVICQTVIGTACAIYLISKVSSQN